MGFFDKKTSNPSLGEKTYDKVGRATDSSVMTVDGAIGKTAILLGLVALGAIVTWNMCASPLYFQYVYGMIAFGAIGAFIIALIICFKQTMAPYLSPVYAVLEGLALGGISAILNAQFGGIVFEAICLTILVATLMLILYKFRIIKATEKFRSVVILATGAIAIFYVVSFILSFFNVYSPLYLSSTAPLWLAVGINVVVIVVAALNLILDFDFIEKGAEYGAPKFMEWYGAFGLTLTLVWLYLEILKLLARLADR